MVAGVLQLLGGFLKLALLAGAVLYFGLVLTSYFANGPQHRPQVNWHDKAHSAELLAVWLGVGALALAVRVGTPIYGMLSEASADVGEWFLARTTREASSEK